MWIVSRLFVIYNPLPYAKKKDFLNLISEEQRQKQKVIIGTKIDSLLRDVQQTKTLMIKNTLIESDRADL